MSLLDKTYFIFGVNIPESKYSNLDSYISRYENEVLTELLGYSLMKDVEAYDPNTSTQPIKALVEGKEYTNAAGYLVRWNGLINAEKVSLISQYVFYFWTRDNQTFISTIGGLQSNAENATLVPVLQRINSEWGLLRELYNSAHDFLKMFESDYPDWAFTDIGSVNSWDL